MSAASTPSAANPRWEKIWSSGLSQGQRWDHFRHSPALEALLQSGKVPPSSGKDRKAAIVPGCGRGYDVHRLAVAGFDCTGLELSPTALKTAQEWLASEERVSERAACDVSGEAGCVQFNFLVDTVPEPVEFGYDYTFFCAMDPDERPAWAAGWARNLAPGGLLATLAFPIPPGYRTGEEDKKEAEGAEEVEWSKGPPYPVHLGLYREQLEPAGFELVESWNVQDANSHEGRGGRETMAIWRRKAE